MRAPGLVGPLLALTLLAAGCSAPLEPESRRRDASSSPTSDSSAPAPSPSTSPSPSASPTADPLEGEQRPPKAVPSITVPSLPKGRRYRGLVLGADASWPQCPQGMGIPQKRSQGSPMPVAAARFVILGLTNGPGFYPNPCLADQVEWVRSRNLLAGAYSVISYPERRHLVQYRAQGPYDGSTRLGALGNVGYQQARFNLAVMEKAGLRSPVVWLDVEPVPEFEWSGDLGANAAVVRGAARGYTDAGLRIGAYSTQALWQQVVGDLALGIPEWRAAGQTSRAEALRRCGPDRMFQGGQAVISQWVEAGRDMNVTCPGTSRDMLRWFHQY